MKRYRIERDAFGEREVPLDAYYGVQTLRGKENFTVSGYPFSAEIVHAVIEIKLAAAIANFRIGKLPKKKYEVIAKACKEALTGTFSDQFFLDAIQGGATTSVNMNVNEVIANRALELLGEEKGNYTIIHPNDHVNMSQSTNDVMPTAFRIFCIRKLDELIVSINTLTSSLRAKEKEFATIPKLGRTHLQDAVPMLVGEEFGAWAAMVESRIVPLQQLQDRLPEIALGGTAVGNSINASDDYLAVVTKELSKITKIPLHSGSNLFALTQGVGIYASLSGELKALAVDLSKIANDIRLLAGGPVGGLDEFILPELQPGSSIMPGKVNPIIPELLNQLCFAVIGNDTAITLAASGGQLELNVFGSLLMHKLDESFRFLSKGMDEFANHCIRGIQVNEQACKRHLLASTAFATKLSQYIGYTKASTLAHQSIAQQRSFYEVVKEAAVVTDEQLHDVFSAAT